MVYGDISISRGLKLGSLTTAQRTGWDPALGAGDDGMAVFDNDLNQPAFFDGSSWLLGMVEGSASLFDLADVSPSDFSGASNYLVNVNSGGTALEFTNPATIVPANETPIAFQVNSSALAVSLSGTNNHTIDILTLSADGGQLLTLGTDGGLLLTNAAITDIYVDGASINASTNVLTLTDNDGGTPDVTIDLSQLDENISNTNLTLDGARVITQAGNVLTFDELVEVGTLRFGDTGTDSNKWTITEDGSGNLDFDNNAVSRLAISSAGVISFNAAFSFPNVDGSINQYLATDGSGNLVWTSPAGGFTSFDLTDGSNTETVSDGQTITFTDGNGISAVVSASDTITFGLDLGSLTAAAPVSADSIVYYDTSAGDHKRQVISSFLAPYISTFTATTEWGTAAGGYYTITITAATHGKGTTPSVILYEEDGGSGFDQVLVDNVNINASGDVAFRVPETPDTRFAGKVEIRY